MTSPMEAFVLYPVLDFHFTITNSSFYLILAASLSVVFSSALFSRHLLVSNNWQLLSESFFRTILAMIDQFIGQKFSSYLPILYSLFYLILFSNFLGLLPYSTTPTVEIFLTLSLAFTLLFGILLIGFLHHQFYLIAVFLPAGTPLFLIPLMVFLEVLAFIFRTLSLGLRLAINLITGHILAKVFAGFIWLGFSSGLSFVILLLPFTLLTIFLSLEILVAYLQSYIFIFIACLTFKDLTQF